MTLAVKAPDQWENTNIKKKQFFQLFKFHLINYCSSSSSSVASIWGRVATRRFGESSPRGGLLYETDSSSALGA